MQGLIRLLSTCASGSPLCAKTLLHLGISGILKDILSGSGVSANSAVPPALSRPAEQVVTASLVNSFLSMKMQLCQVFYFSGVDVRNTNFI